MPLKRSATMRDLGTYIGFSRKRSNSSEAEASGGSHSESSSVETGLGSPADTPTNTGSSHSFTCTRMAKRLRIHAEGLQQPSTLVPVEKEPPEVKFRCLGCKRTSMKDGFYMYLDQCFCSEQCRSEAITLDEIELLTLS